MKRVAARPTQLRQLSSGAPRSSDLPQGPCANEDDPVVLTPGGTVEEVRTIGHGGHETIGQRDRPDHPGIRDDSDRASIRCEEAHGGAVGTLQSDRLELVEGTQVHLSSSCPDTDERDPAAVRRDGNRPIRCEQLDASRERELQPPDGRRIGSAAADSGPQDECGDAKRERGDCPRHEAHPRTGAPTRCASPISSDGALIASAISIRASAM